MHKLLVAAKEGRQDKPKIPSGALCMLGCQGVCSNPCFCQEEIAELLAEGLPIDRRRLMQEHPMRSCLHDCWKFLQATVLHEAREGEYRTI